MLNALATFLPRSDRIAIIEETAELQVDKPNVCESKPGMRRAVCQP